MNTLIGVGTTAADAVLERRDVRPGYSPTPALPADVYYGAGSSSSR